MLWVAVKTQAQDQKLKILTYAYTPSGESAHKDPKASGKRAMEEDAEEMNWDVYYTEDPNYFTDENLAPYDVIFFNNMCCKNGIFTRDSQREAAEKAFRNGAGYVATHGVGAATGYVTNWPFLQEINGNGGEYNSHFDKNMSGIIHVDDPDHYINQGLDPEWELSRHEFFRFPVFPEDSKVHVLGSVVRGSAGVGTQLSAEYLPVSWCHYYEGSRAFYTSLAHWPEAFTDPKQKGHIYRALEWAGGRAPQTGACGEPTTGVFDESQRGGEKRVFAERFFSLQVAQLELRGATLEPGSFRIELFDSRGAKVAQQEIQGAKSFSLKVRKAGTYFVRAYAGTSWFTRHIVIL